MTTKKAFLIIESILIVVVAIMLITGAMSIYSNGLEARAADPSADIYTIEAIASTAKPVLPVFAVLIVFTIICAILGVKDLNANKASKIEVEKIQAEKATEGSNLSKVRLAIIGLAILFIIIGIFNGSLMDVLIKASKICTECIGLG